MRASMSRSYRIGDPDLCDALQQLERTLVANGADEISGINIYFTPRAGGRVLTLHTSAGETIDHLKLEAEQSRVFRYADGIRVCASLRVQVPDYMSPPEREPRWVLSDIGYLRDKWRLTTEELLTLLCVTKVRLQALLKFPETRLTEIEHVRISALHEISRLLQDASKGESVADWLRSSCTMAKYAGATPLTQLLLFQDDAIELMRDALTHYLLLKTFGPGAGELQAGFDTLLDIPVDWESWYKSD